MEALISAAVVILLCVCVGLSAEVMLTAFMIVIAAGTAFIFLFFLGCSLSLVGSRRINVNFCRIDKNKNNGFDVAFYSDSENNEYPNAFPSEMLFKRFLYNKDKTYAVRLCRKKNKVYDMYSMITVITGLLLGGASFAGMIMYLLGSFS